MKRLGISQRLTFVPSHQEWRDCLDQRWHEIAHNLGFHALPLPNLSENIDDYLQALHLDAIVLSGGNSLAVLNPEAEDAAPIRDKFEKCLIDFALKNDVPLLGVCRGMQMIHHQLGGHLQAVTGHVATRHPLKLSSSCDLPLPTEVNSYHGFAIPNTNLPDTLEVLASDYDGFVEAFQHKTKRIAGIMWHPEREEINQKADLTSMEKLLR